MLVTSNLQLIGLLWVFSPKSTQIDTRILPTATHLQATLIINNPNSLTGLWTINSQLLEVDECGKAANILFGADRTTQIDNVGLSAATQLVQGFFDSIKCNYSISNTNVQLYRLSYSCDPYKSSTLKDTSMFLFRPNLESVYDSTVTQVHNASGTVLHLGRHRQVKR